MISQAVRCLALILLLVATGCDSGSIDASDEQKDPHYLNGRSRVSSQDYKGAVEEFEKALEANPRSASAHFELAWLNEEKMKDYAAAIYHYEQHLRLNPKSEYTDRARDRIRACKMDLVKTEVLAPVNQGMQNDLEKLTAENLLLKRQLEALQNQLNATRQNASTVTPLPESPSRAAPSGSDNSVTGPMHSNNPATRVTPLPQVAPQRAKNYVVKAGETFTSIAAKNHVSIAAFMKANPRVDPRRMKVGQVLNVPSAQ